MLAPVWIPIGSKFSIEQMIVTLSLESLSNSNSYSFQPMTALSIMTSWIGLKCSPRVSAASNSSGLCIILAPLPPSVYEGRMHRGKPNSCAASLPSKKLFAVAWGAIEIFNSSMSKRKRSRFSVISMAAISTPIILTPNSSQSPISSHWMHKLSAVCPPMVGNTESIECFFNIFSIDAGSKGSK